MRSLTQAEAYGAMRMIAQYEIEPEQLGAFLMLLRVKEETPEEVAGMTVALRESLPPPRLMRQPAIDWPAYAGKKRHLPWFLLAALLLGQHGYPVLMHGLSRDDERIYVPQALQALGLETADTWPVVEQQLQHQGFAFLPIDAMSELTAELIETRQQLGLRSPINSVARMLNPLRAPLSVLGVFHPNYAAIHQQAARLLDAQQTLVAKGEGGEFERLPERAVQVALQRQQQLDAQPWEALEKPGRLRKPAQLDLNHFAAVWRGAADDVYGTMAVTGTLAIVIHALGLAPSPAAAQQLADHWWQMRRQTPSKKSERA